MRFFGDSASAGSKRDSGEQWESKKQRKGGDVAPYFNAPPSRQK